MNDLALMGYDLNENLTITHKNEVEIDLWNIPWQHLKKAAIDIAVRSRTDSIAKKRTFCGDIKEIDSGITKKITNHLGVKEQKISGHLYTGGFWNEQQKVQLQTSDGKCAHCRMRVDNSSHPLWNCPVINKRRKHRKLDEIDADRLPLAVQNGSPPAMGHDFTKAYWPQDSNNNNNNTNNEIPDDHDVLIGIPQRKWLNKAKSSNQLLIQAINTKHNLELTGDSFQELETNARQVFTNLKHDSTTTAMPMPEPCKCKPPKDINVFSDGSWLFPLKQYLGIGGAGVWWPKRVVNSTEDQDNDQLIHRLSKAESEIAIAEQTKKGTRLFTKIGGYAGSSTRTELAAGIIAICAWGAIHLGSDSRAFVDQANYFIKLMKKGKNLKNIGSCTVMAISGITS